MYILYLIFPNVFSLVRKRQNLYLLCKDKIFLVLYEEINAFSSDE